jgi:hypothetical protein
LESELDLVSVAALEPELA